MENKLVKRDISQLNENITVMSSSSVVLMCTILFLVLSIVVWLFAGTVTEKACLKGVVFPAGGTSDVCLPKAGVVRSVFVQKGQQVQAGQNIALVSVGESYSVVTSASDGVVFSCKQDNETFEAFEPVASLINESGGSGSVMLLAYSDLTNLKDIAEGQEVQVWPSNEQTDEVGYVRGRVSSVGRFPVEKVEAARKIKVQEYISELIPEGVTSYEIGVTLGTDPDNPDGLDWTFDRKYHPDMSTGTLCDAIVITHTYSIFEYLFLKARMAGNRVKTWID